MVSITFIMEYYFCVFSTSTSVNYSSIYFLMTIELSSTCNKILVLNSRLDPTDDVPIYNCCASNLNNITMGELVEVGKQIACFYPLNAMLWTVGGSITSSKMYHYAKVSTNVQKLLLLWSGNLQAVTLIFLNRI